jgi:signal transduction histidine kinase
MYLESRRMGNLLLLRFRDDGRGFDPSNPPPAWASATFESAPGRSAGAVGAGLDAISAPGRGTTTVQIRFRTRENPQAPNFLTVNIPERGLDRPQKG